MINFLVFYPLFYKILLFPLFLIKEIAHLFMWAPLMRINAKRKALLWIISHWKTIKDNRNYIKKEKNLDSYDFFQKLSRKLSDAYFVSNGAKKIIICFWNSLFRIYSAIINILLKLLKSINT